VTWEIHLAGNSVDRLPRLELETSLFICLFVFTKREIKEKNPFLKK
jgi:hypothetical protein